MLCFVQVFNVLGVGHFCLLHGFHFVIVRVQTIASTSFEVLSHLVVATGFRLVERCPLSGFSPLIRESFTIRITAIGGSNANRIRT